MTTLFNFQINIDNDRKEWESVKAHTKPFKDRVAAVLFAKRLSRIFKAEVRLSQGTNPFKESGSYFHYKQL